MARTYRRDARGRFSGGGSGQTGGRGARLKSGGQTRAGGGAKVKAASPDFRGGTIAKGGNGIRGSVARSLAAVKAQKKTSASSAPKAAAKKPSIEKRLERSWMRRRDANTSVDNRNWGGGKIGPSTTGARGQARVANLRKRQEQQSRAITNLVGKLKPSGQKKANAVRRRLGV